MSRTIFLVLLFAKISLEAAYCFDGNPTYEDCCLYQNIEDARIEFGYTTGNYISIDKGYGWFGALKPLCLSEEYRPFIDARANVFTDGKWAATGGVGYRGDTGWDSVAGFNVYYDYRRGECKNSFNQVGVGVEWLHECFDMHLNGYIPVGKQSKPCDRRLVEFAYTGFDASIGSTLFSYRGFNLYALGGTYYFYQSKQPHFWGGFGSLELDWKTLITLQVRFSSDRVYQKNVQGIFQLSFPLELFYCVRCNECYDCRDLLSQPVRRIGMILLDQGRKKKTDCCK